MVLLDTSWMVGNDGIEDSLDADDMNKEYLLY